MIYNSMYPTMHLTWKDKARASAVSSWRLWCISASTPPQRIAGPHWSRAMVPVSTMSTNANSIELLTTLLAINEQHLIGMKLGCQLWDWDGFKLSSVVSHPDIFLSPVCWVPGSPGHLPLGQIPRRESYTSCEHGLAEGKVPVRLNVRLYHGKGWCGRPGIEQLNQQFGSWHHDFNSPLSIHCVYLVHSCCLL